MLMMEGYPYEGLEDMLAVLTPEPGWILRNQDWRLQVEDFIKERRARLSCPPGGPSMPRSWKRKLPIPRSEHVDLLHELEKCVSELSKSGRPSTRMKEILKKLDYDRRPVLLAYQRFIKEEWAHLPDSEHTNSTGDHDALPPQPDPLPAPSKQPPPSKQIEEQMDLLNYLEACLEDHNRLGYPPIEGLEGMVKQMTTKQVRGPEAIKKFIVEQ